MYHKLELRYTQWLHSKVLKTGCSVRKNLNLEYITHTLQANFLGMYPGHEPSKFCDDPLKPAVPKLWYAKPSRWYANRPTTFCLSSQKYIHSSVFYLSGSVS